MADVRFRQAAFLGVDQIIRFDQNLVVDAVNRAKRVVVRHQPDDALDRIGWDIGPFKNARVSGAPSCSWYLPLVLPYFSRHRGQAMS